MGRHGLVVDLEISTKVTVGLMISAIFSNPNDCMTSWHVAVVVFPTFSKEFWEYLIFAFPTIFIGMHVTKYLPCVKEGKLQRSNVELRVVFVSLNLCSLSFQSLDLDSGKLFISLIEYSNCD